MIDIDESEIARITAMFDATPEQVEKAARSTLNKLARWMKSRASSDYAKAFKLQRAYILRRLRVTMGSKGKNHIRLWFGLNPVSLIHFHAKQTAKGVTADGETYAGAFIQKGQVFKRVGKARLPIVKLTKDISAQGEEVMRKLGDREIFMKKFAETFEHEMKWQTKSR
jgi:hypothetical protein